MLAHANAHNILLFFSTGSVFLNGKNWGICSRFPQVLRTTAAPEPTHPPGGRGCKISKAARVQDHTPGIARARPKFGGFWEFLEPLGGSRIMHAHTRPRRNDSPPKFARLNAHARKRRYFLRKPPYLEGNGLIQGITHPNGGKCLKRPKNSQSGGTLRGGGVYVCTRDDYPLF